MRTTWHEDYIYTSHSPSLPRSELKHITRCTRQSSATFCTCACASPPWRSWLPRVRHELAIRGYDLQCPPAPSSRESQQSQEEALRTRQRCVACASRGNMIAVLDHKRYRRRSRLMSTDKAGAAQNKFTQQIVYVCTYQQLRKRYAATCTVSRLVRLLQDWWLLPPTTRLTLHHQ